MPSDQKSPSRLIAVRRVDLATMARWKCTNLVKEGGPCAPEAVESGECCRACWASAFAEKALRGASVRLPKVEECTGLDVWDLLNSFGETVRQLGGGFTYDFTTGQAYLRPPNFTGETMIPVHVVEAVPGEVGGG